MKNTKSTIPLALRKIIDEDPFYSVCSLFGVGEHECGGRITREHAIRYGGSNVQTLWAIIPLCAKGHDVDGFQDGHGLKKELNEWVAYSRASDADLLALTGEVSVTPLSKVKPLFDRKRYLVNKYGAYEIKKPTPAQIKMDLPEKKHWHALTDRQVSVVKRAQAHLYKATGVAYSSPQIIAQIFESYDKELSQIEEIAGEGSGINY